MDKNVVLKGDCLEEMKKLPANSVDTIITDPPYGLSFMGKKWDYDVPAVDVWKECLRVLKPGGTALIFAGSRTQHRMAVNVEDAGFILKDTIMWFYGSGFPKATDISKQLDKGHGRERVLRSVAPIKGGKNHAGGTSGRVMDYIQSDVAITEEAKLWNGWKSHGLKPAYEPIIVCMKPNEGTYAANALKHGVSGLNIDGGRIGSEGGVKKVSIEENSANHNGDGFGCNGKLEKLNKGRFPANIILDEEAGRLLDEQSGISKTTPRPIADGEKLDKDGNWGFKRMPHNISDKGGASRFFYCAKASKGERNAGCEKLEETYNDESRHDKDAIGCNNPRNRSGTAKKNHHPTVKPLSLMKYLCTLTKTPTGGIVLDPFAGSGTTGVACILTDRDYVLIEREEEYVEIINYRLTHIEEEIEEAITQPLHGTIKTSLDEWGF